MQQLTHQMQRRSCTLNRAPTSRQVVPFVQASTGFGKPTKQKKAPAPKPTQTKSASAVTSKTPTQAQPVSAVAATNLVGTTTPEQLKGGAWNKVLDNVEDFFQQAGKDIKAITLSAGKTLVLYRFEGVVYCSDVYSTAFQYPMIDAKISKRQDGTVLAEVPLDGTVYELLTGKVVVWCPKNDNPLKNVLATLKRRDLPIPLTVYPTEVNAQGQVRVRL